jgi:hypothetical protein
MKLAHQNKATGHSYEAAKQLERNGDWEDAAKTYEGLLNLHPLNQTYYDRLMIAYRKLKLPKKELSVIKKGISQFEKLYKRPDTHNKKVARLSRALQKATGLVDEHGKSNYEPAPLGRWRKRKSKVEKLASVEK